MLNIPDETLQIAWDCLNSSIETLKNGGDVDLSEFDGKARAFCATLSELPPSESKQYGKSIEELIWQLNNLTQNIEVQMGELEHKINSLNRQNTANNAYGHALFLALQTARDND